MAYREKNDFKLKAHQNGVAHPSHVHGTKKWHLWHSTSIHRSILCLADSHAQLKSSLKFPQTHLPPDEPYFPPHLCLLAWLLTANGPLDPSLKDKDVIAVYFGELRHKKNSNYLYFATPCLQTGILKVNLNAPNEGNTEETNHIRPRYSESQRLQLCLKSYLWKLLRWESASIWPG